MIIIATVSIFSMLWFPLLFNIVEGKNTLREKAKIIQLMRKYFKKRNSPLQFVNQGVPVEVTDGDEITEVHSGDKDEEDGEQVSFYDRGDVPYSIKRFMVVVSNSGIRIKGKLSCYSFTDFFPDMRFMAFLCSIFCVSYYFLDKYVNDNLPPDVQNYSLANKFPKNLGSCILSISVFLFIYMALLTSQKNYTYVLDPTLILTSKSNYMCLRKLHFRLFLHNKFGATSISQNIINRVTPVLIPRFWMTFFSISLTGTRQLLRKKSFCLFSLFLLLWILSLPISVFFQMLTALCPFIWLTFCVYRAACIYTITYVNFFCNDGFSTIRLQHQTVQFITDCHKNGCLFWMWNFLCVYISLHFVLLCVSVNVLLFS